MKKISPTINIGKICIEKRTKNNSMLKNYRSLGADIARSFVMILVIAFCSSCTGVSAQGINKTQIANPASVNCIKQGGTLSIQKSADGGEYGICVFADNRQCEEWALLRGECPANGKKITTNPVKKTTPGSR